MADIKFTKMQATGNDFVVMEAKRNRDWGMLANSMCDRRFGVGADGIILVMPSKKADIMMRMFNPDGSEAEACGNGTRCLVKYAMDRGLVDRGEITIETLGGLRKARELDDMIQVDMGEPVFKAGLIPVKANRDAVIDYPLTIGGRRLSLTCLSMGNPHAVAFIDEPVEKFPLEVIGPKVERHAFFPKRVNFEIANILGKNKIRARVWERGAGETLSCGSGACAIAVAAGLHNLCGKKTDIMLPGGTLTIDWDGKGEVKLTGPAEEVFTGTWPG
ncbi:MAG: diaminopimelate epimerase [Dehalococcoidia bacterium]|jgi:diaminopimelate epimerase